MLPHIHTRFAIATALAGLQILSFVVDVYGICWDNLFSTDPAKKRWKYSNSLPWRRITTLGRQFIAPMTVGLFAVISISIVFSKIRAEDAANIIKVDHFFDKYGYHYFCNDTDNAARVDADIAGDGIRIAIWTQICFLIVIAIMGTFHCKATGAKELGAGLAVTHFSLAVTLLVQHGRGTLSPADAIIGAMILDAQNSALLIQLGTKETLAARWQVGIITACQITGLAVIPLFVNSFQQGGRSRFGAPLDSSSRCLSVFWWTFFGNCSIANDNSPYVSTLCNDYDEIFWVYYCCRCICVAQSTFLALVNTQLFHLAEKGNRTLNGITFPHMSTYRNRSRRSDQEEASLLSRSDNSPGETVSEIPHEEGEYRRGSPERRYTEPLEGLMGNRLHYTAYPSTVTLMYSVHGIFALTSMASAEMAIRDNSIRPSSEIFSVGQVTGIAVAGATSVRAAWLFFRMFFEKGKDGFKFLWPFSFDFLGAMYSPTFIICPPTEDGIARFPEYRRRDGRELRLGDVLTFTPGAEDVAVSRLTNLGEVPGLDDHKYTEVIPNALIKVRGVGVFSMDELETRYLFPDSGGIVSALLAASRIPTFKPPAGFIPESKRKHKSRFVVTGLMLARQPRTQGSAWPPWVSTRSTVLFAYQLQEVKERFGGRFDTSLQVVYDGAKVAEWSVLEERSVPAGGDAPTMSGAIL